MLFIKHCFSCDSGSTTYGQWYNNNDSDGNRLCRRCYTHLFSSYKRYRSHYSSNTKYSGVDQYNLERNKLFDIIGRICVKCSISDIRVLMFDHINGGGNREQKRFRNNYHMYRYYVRHPEEALRKIQTLCANCNRIKAVENKEFPHRLVLVRN